MIILAADVHYQNQSAKAAGVIFSNWSDSEPLKEITACIDEIQEYVPGQFYKRELPCIMAVLEQIERLPDIIVIDGFVTLGREKRPGLGKYLYNELKRKVPVIGAAKNPFKDTPSETEVYRGRSSRPLYVSCAGMDLAEARQCIADMHGKYRIPDLLKKVDLLCRSVPPFLKTEKEIKNARHCSKN